MSLNSHGDAWRCSRHGSDQTLLIDKLDADKWEDWYKEVLNSKN